MVIYQDRLGANTGKTPKLTCLQPNAQEQLRRGFSRHHETGRRTVDSYRTATYGRQLPTATVVSTPTAPSIRISEVLGTLSEGIKEELSSTMVKRFEALRGKKTHLFCAILY